MKIGIITSPWFSVPPETHGGREKFVHDLATYLGSQLHDVIIYGVKNKNYEYQYYKVISPCYTEEQRLYLSTSQYATIETEHMYQSYMQALADKVDIIHDNTGYFPGLQNAINFIYEMNIKLPILKTFHGIVTQRVESIFSVINQYDNFYINSISHNQALSMKIKNYCGNVYNFIQPNDYISSYTKSKEEYYVMLNRIVPGKGVDIAIEIARRAKVKIKIAGMLEDSYEMQQYFKTKILPYLGDTIEYIGEVNHTQKVKLLTQASGYIFPVQWDEPFGLSVIESLACGTPVLAFKKGAMDEIISTTEVGYVVNDLNEMLDKLPYLKLKSSEICREHINKFFSAHVLAEKYVQIYKQMIVRCKNE